MHNIVSIGIMRMWETCERTTYYVRLTTDEGFTKEPASFRTGHVHHEDGKKVAVPGLSMAEARDRALIEAHSWADLLGLTVEPFEDVDGIVYEPSMRFESYAMRRKISARRGRTGTPVED